MKKVQLLQEPMPYGKVLVVDEKETNINVAKGLLSLYKLHIDSALDGFEAIRKIRKGCVYDIIFISHAMTQIDGIETASHMRYIGYDRPVIAVIASAIAEHTKVFLKSGFNDVLYKPVDIRQLNIILNKHIRDKYPQEVIEKARQSIKKKPNDRINKDRYRFNRELSGWLRENVENTNYKEIEQKLVSSRK